MSRRDEIESCLTVYGYVIRNFESGLDHYFKRTQILMIVIQSTLFLSFGKLVQSILLSNSEGNSKRILILLLIGLIAGLGALSADLCIVGDIRDLGVQSWKYLTEREDFDRLVMILSAAGLGLSSTPFINGCDSLAKNIIKYLKKIPWVANRGVLKQFLSGNMTKQQYSKVWHLLKKTSGQFPELQPAYLTSTT